MKRAMSRVTARMRSLAPWFEMYASSPDVEAGIDRSARSGIVASPNLVWGDAMPRDASDLLHGTLDVLILKTLTWGTKHGYVDRRVDRGAWRRRARDRRRRALQGAAPSRGRRRDRVGVGTLRQQPAREVLLAHAARPRTAARREPRPGSATRRRSDAFSRRADASCRSRTASVAPFDLPTTSERIARELDDEVRFHVEERAKKLIDQGYSTEAAYAEALRRFGDVDDLRDYCVTIEVSHMQRVEFRERLRTIGAGLPLRVPPTAQEPELRVSRGTHARAGRRRDDGDLQRREWRHPATAAVPRVGADGARLRHRLEGPADGRTWPTRPSTPSRIGNRSFTALAKIERAVARRGDRRRIDAAHRRERVSRGLLPTCST